MFCNHCGAACDDGAKFCPACGVDFSAPTPVQPGYQPPVYQQPIQPVYQPPIYQQLYPVVPAVPGKGQGIASLVLGIISLVLLISIDVSFICAIVGIILGSVAISKAKSVGMKNGFAVAGLTCSIIAVCLMIIIFVLFIVALTMYGFEMMEGYEYYEYYM